MSVGEHPMRGMANHRGEIWPIKGLGEFELFTMVSQ